MGIIELLTRIGEANIRLQNLKDSATKFRPRVEGGMEITFATDQISRLDLVDPRAEQRVCLVLWLPAKKVKLAEAQSADALRCTDCGLAYELFPRLDVMLSQEQRDLIGQVDLLCAWCITKRAAKVPGAVALRLHIDIATPKEG